MRLSEIAQHLAELENRDPESTLIRLRNPLVKQLMSGTPGRRVKSPVGYDPLELLRARLLLAMGDIPLTTTEMGAANETLNQPPALRKLPDWAEDRVIPSGLKCLVNAARAGEDWNLILVIRIFEGERRISSFIAPAGEGETASRASRAVDLRDGPTIARVVLPASDLIKPLLGVLD
ncbi:hypothetical protein [Marivita sp. S2033]|uniref:hypothetical protein n=1 Tax=Marivita sp. S2033 TaxID=3373187 RepID=UPI00398297DB